MSASKGTGYITEGGVFSNVAVGGELDVDGDAQVVGDLTVDGSFDAGALSVQQVDLKQDSEENTWFGFEALNSVTPTTQENNNTAIGHQAGKTLAGAGSTGNTYIGSLAGTLNAPGFTGLNTAVGASAMGAATDMSQCTAIGDKALSVGTTGSLNVCVGQGAGQFLDGAGSVRNTFVGTSAGNNFTGTAIDNVAIGNNAGSGPTGAENTVVGAEGGASMTGDSNRNTFIGYRTSGVISGEVNDTILIGHRAGEDYDIGASDMDNNIVIGHPGVAAGEDDTIRLGNAQTKCFVAGIDGVTPDGTPTLVTMGSGATGANQLGDSGIAASSVGLGGGARTWTEDEFLVYSAVDWSVNNIAPSLTDPLTTVLIVRNFVHTADSAVGLHYFIPAGTTTLTFTIQWRKDVASVNSVTWDIHAASFADGTDVTGTPSWDTSETIGTFSDNDALLHKSSSAALTLAALSVSAGELAYFQIVRDTTDTHASPAYLLSATITPA